jgi:hypothetical protein
MIMKRIILGIFILSAVTFNSCNKFEEVNAPTQEIKQLTKEEYKNLMKKMDALPMIIKYYDEKNDQYIDFDVKNRSVSVNKIWSFANPEPNTIYASGGGLVVYISSSSTNWGYGSPTHTITAGSTTLNVQTLCLAVDASAYAAMFAGQTGELPYTGISVVMGLDADFSLLENASSSNFGNFFRGLAYYLVYDSPASGAYDVIDWTNYNGIFPDQLGFAMVFSFDLQNNFGAFYFSQDGQLNVSGGDISFNGNYWGIETIFDNINPSLSYGTYSGSGTMGCQ